MSIVLAGGAVAAVLAWHDPGLAYGILAAPLVVVAGMHTRLSRRRLGPLLLVSAGLAAVALAAGAWPL